MLVDCMPFKSESVTIPNNKKQAGQRLNSLCKTFEGNSEFHESSKAFMDKIICKRICAKSAYKGPAPRRRTCVVLTTVCFSLKRKKNLRVVFNCAAKFKGTSLNEQLLQGPGGMIGILQVIVEFQMMVHLFGATSPPRCANFCLRKTAQDWTGHLSDESIKTVHKHFYVDDCLKSVENVKSAIFLVKELQRLLGNSGFHIAKWNNNSREVVNSIPVSERANEVKDLDLDNDILPIERALGVGWCMNSDSFQFKLDLKRQPLTRRGILSMVSSIYDPVVFWLHSYSRPNSFCRTLQLKLGWDDKIPDELAIHWNHWYQELLKLKDFKVNRCF